jgi:O-antigen/teichoic acid export membrane protein
VDESADLKRLFAQHACLPPDAGFTAAVSQQIARRRRRRALRSVTVAIALSIAAAGLAVLLAPFAPVPDPSLTTTLLRLPETLGDAALAHVTRLDEPYLIFVYLAVATCALPLAGVFWLMRRN